MTILPVIPFNYGDGFWLCHMCWRIISAVIVENLKKELQYEPESKYWNMERNEVYCSAQHSLDVHQKIKEGNHDH